MLRVQEATTNKPIRAIIYGIEGVGKTNLIAKSDNPIFINIEDRLDHLRDKNGNKLKHLGIPKTLDDVNKQLDDLYNFPHSFKTIGVDSLDWLERLVHAKIIGTSNKSMASAEGGFGKAFDRSLAMHNDIREKLTKLRNERGMDIFLTAHYAVKMVKDPEAIADYQAFEIKCHEKVSAMWREFADIVLFARFETFVKDGEDGQKTIASGTGKRIIQTEKRPTQQAKNCFGLPPEVHYNEHFYDNMMAHIRGLSTDQIKSISIDEIKKDIEEMYLNVTDDKMKALIRETIDGANGDLEKLKGINTRMKDLNLNKKQEEKVA